MKRETLKRMAFLLLPSLLSSQFWKLDIKKVGKADQSDHFEEI